MPNERCACPKCQKSFQVPDSLLGANARCPQCRTVLVVKSVRGKTMLDFAGVPSDATTALYEPDDQPSQAVTLTLPPEGDKPPPERKSPRRRTVLLAAIAGTVCLLFCCGGVGTISWLARHRPNETAPSQRVAQPETRREPANAAPAPPAQPNRAPGLPPVAAPGMFPGGKLVAHGEGEATMKRWISEHTPNASSLEFLEADARGFVVTGENGHGRVRWKVTDLRGNSFEKDEIFVVRDGQVVRHQTNPYGKDWHRQFSIATGQTGEASGNPGSLNK